MAKIELTRQQQEVVDARDCSLLVAAAAGSGKTAVLVRRIIEKVVDAEQPQDIDRLLIVTFTNAAAAEMRERIGAAMEEELQKNPDNAHLQRQMILLHNAQIMTIHSFCLSVIKEHFHLLSLDPAFRIGDETELSLLSEDVLEELLEEYYTKAEPDFLAFADCYGTAKSDKAIMDYVKRLYHYAGSNPWPEEWLHSLIQEVSLQPVFDQVMESVKESLQDTMLLVNKMIALAEEADGPVLYRDCFTADAEMLSELSQAAEQGYDSFAEALQNNSFGRLPSKRQDCDEEKKEQAKALRATVKEILGKLQKDYFFASREELSEDLSSVGETLQALVRLTLDFMKRYQERKQEKNLLDFSDLEHLALSVLVYKENGETLPTEAARALAKRYDEIMIDEYQDSNLIQEYVLKSVSGEWDDAPNLFMVGDVKQSIYRFRMAKPELFMKKYKEYQESGSYRKIDLHKNFRSRAEILSAINVLFAGLMHEKTAEIEYDAAAALYYGAGESYTNDTEDNRTEVLFVNLSRETTEQGQPETDVEQTETDETEGDAEELSAEEKTAVCMEAMAVAQRIRELCSGGMQIKGSEGMRQAAYSDIVILLRTMSGWSETFLEVLSEQGIPAYADTQSGYFRAVEVQKVLNFLRILDNPKQDIPFAAVLHSPIAGLSAEDMAAVRIQYGQLEDNKTQRTLYEAARKMAEETSPLAEKLRLFFELYDRLQQEAEYLSIHELLEHIYAYSGYYDIVSVMLGGERRRGNLSMLVTKAKQYEATSYSGLYDFVRYIDRLMKYEVDFGEAKTEESGNMVRIMSIHKSKGLEFPIVFVSGMNKHFNRMDTRERLIFHPSLGIGADLIDRTLRTKSPTLLKRVIVKKLSREMMAEELRILYVAMTRAKEKLILTGTVKSPERIYSSWKQKAQTVGLDGLPSAYLQSANSYYDFICPLLFQTIGEDSMAGTTLEISRTTGAETFTGHFYMKELTGEDLSAELAAREWETRELDEVLEVLQTAEPSETEQTRKLRSRLKQQEEFSYPFQGEANLPIKVSVSELKRKKLLEEEEEETELLEELKETLQKSEKEEALKKSESEEELYPSFLQAKKEISGSDRGTIYHRVMELLPFEVDYTKQKLTEMLEAWKETGRVSEQEVNSVSCDKLLRFFQSGLGKRMQKAAKAGQLYKEQPFVLGIPANELYPETESREPVLVQGIIDAFFIEENAIVLMDYKTDYVKQDAKEELSKKYKPQLEYYKRALEQLYELPVKEMWFYAFSKDCDFMV